MPYHNRKVVLEAFGEPTTAATLKTDSIAAPDTGKILVRTAYAPVNPADLNILEGRYGKLPALPATIGTEGAGKVIAVDPGVSDITPGDQVFYLSRTDCWQDYVTCAAHQVIKLPKELPEEASCMLKINPATAWLLLHQDSSPNPKSWIVQNAANSGVGQAVIAIAKTRSQPTINFVRRRELIAPLRQAGGTIVVLDNDAGKAAALETIGKNPVALALNAVGGESALRIMSMLSEGGIHITYGAMSKRPLKVPNSFLIFKGLQVRGLWLTQWLSSARHSEIAKIYRKLAGLMLEGKLQQPVDSVFPPEEICAAITKATEGGRSGKVLLDFRTKDNECKQ
ncbi:MAG: 2-enoyl thioester reductase domain-containing protein [Verrucomicrobiales bacterium]